MALTGSDTSSNALFGSLQKITAQQLGLDPVLMTAAAMILGMLPMALALGEGGEQNAPLGRAVIGGLLFATVSTLFFVPVVYAGVHRYLAQRDESRAPSSPKLALQSRQET